MQLLSHDFHVAHGAVTLNIMSLKVAIPRLVLLPVLLLTVATASCSGSGFREGEGTIWIRVTGWERTSGLGVEHCRGSGRVERDPEGHQRPRSGGYGDRPT